MDPNACLVELITLSREVQAAVDTIDADVIAAANADRMAELILSLDGWIRKGGVLPARWQTTGWEWKHEG